MCIALRCRGPPMHDELEWTAGQVAEAQSAATGNTNSQFPQGHGSFDS